MFLVLNDSYFSLGHKTDCSKINKNNVKDGHDWGIENFVILVRNSFLLGLLLVFISYVMFSNQ